METRKRRSAEDTKQEILDVAEKRFVEGGPSAIRLQDIARQVGVSHPAVLHHFGSKEALVDAVVRRAILALQRDLVAALSTPAAGGALDGAAMFERVFDSFAVAGHARMMAWLILSGHRPLAGKEMRENWSTIIDAMHALRTARGKARRDGMREAPHQDTAFTVVLSALALFGQAIAGPTTFEAAGLARDAATEKRFRAWLADLLETHLETGGRRA